MGTPGYVGVLNDDGSILAKYKHYDCDSMSLGVILLDFYQDPERVKAVLADNNYPINRFLPTNDEELKEFINKARTEKYDVDSFDNIFKSIEDFKESSVHVEYSYLYDQKNNEWLVSTQHSPLAELIDDFKEHLGPYSPCVGYRHKNKALDHAISLFLDNPDYFKKLTPYQLKLFDDTLAQETINQKAREFIPLKQFLPYELNKYLNYWIQNNRDHERDSTIEYFNNLIEECVDKNFFTKMDYRSCSENLIIPAHNEFFLNIDSILKKLYNVVSACKEADQKLFDEYDKKLVDCFEPLELKGFVGLIKKKCTELGVKISVKYRNDIYSPFIDLSSPDGTSISEDQMHKIEDFIDEIKIHNTGLFHDLNNDIIYKISNRVFENGKPAIDFPKSDNKIKYFPTEFCHIYTSDLNVVEESNDVEQDLDESIKASDKIESNQSNGIHL